MGRVAVVEAGYVIQLHLRQAHFQTPLLHRLRKVRLAGYRQNRSQDAERRPVWF